MFVSAMFPPNSYRFSLLRYATCMPGAFVLCGFPMHAVFLAAHGFGVAERSQLETTVQDRVQHQNPEACCAKSLFKLYPRSIYITILSAYPMWFFIIGRILYQGSYPGKRDGVFAMCWRSSSFDSTELPPAPLLQIKTLNNMIYLLPPFQNLTQGTDSSLSSWIRPMLALAEPLL